MDSSGRIQSRRIQAKDTPESDQLYPAKEETQKVKARFIKETPTPQGMMRENPNKCQKKRNLAPLCADLGCLHARKERSTQS